VGTNHIPGTAEARAVFEKRCAATQT